MYASSTDATPKYNICFNCSCRLPPRADATPKYNICLNWGCRLPPRADATPKYNICLNWSCRLPPRADATPKYNSCFLAMHWISIYLPPLFSISQSSVNIQYPLLLTYYHRRIIYFFFFFFFGGGISIQGLNIRSQKLIRANKTAVFYKLKVFKGWKLPTFYPKLRPLIKLNLPYPVNPPNPRTPRYSKIRLDKI